MRVRHLTDIEIQALLDRREIGPLIGVSGGRYRKDLDSQEHLDNCPVCRSEMETYRDLYVELGSSGKVILPKNFARKVTFSLPPFRARRTRARLQSAGIWLASLAISLLWLVGQVPVDLIIVQAAGAVMNWQQQVVAMLNVLSAVFPLSDMVAIWVVAPLASAVDTVQRALVVEGGPANTIVLAGMALALIAWVDCLYQTTLRQRN
ncbi:MAG: hypothetical protein AB1772_05125 [Candidatus Zixiibacteriota bacterium]